MSNIAILGWGSLLWRPESLAMTSAWNPDGPLLPLEFARLSGNNTLTLVIHPASPPQQTYWVTSACPSVADARENLGKREGCPTLNPIHALTRTGERFGTIAAEVEPLVAAWLAAHQGLDAVVWTGLKSNWNRGRFTGENAVAYLRDLEEPTLSAAREYVTRAPPQIQTPIRTQIRAALGWGDVPLDTGTIR